MTTAEELKLADFALSVSVDRQSDLRYPTPEADAIYGADMRAGLAVLRRVLDAARVGMVDANPYRAGTDTHIAFEQGLLAAKELSE